MNKQSVSIAEIGTLLIFQNELFIQQQKP